ncbi:aldose 1-epimerase [Maribacter sp. 2210JD10-5]|uniref:aldose 1-epimerase n=1 Tax=Maribacter sp. 2210JD10-5 TaxID=3386272 RepID=UPI0039BC6AB9
MTILKTKNHTVKIEAGELVSYEVDGHEFIHQKGSPGWRSSDTEMFPIIGPTNDANFRVSTPKGDAVQDQHGLLREMEYHLLEQDETEAIFEKVYSAGTLIKNSKFPKKSTEEFLSWPYNFHFTKSFCLNENGLEITFKVEGEEEMPFMLGYHPAFKLHSEDAMIVTKEKEISIADIMAVGSRALQVPHHKSILLKDKKDLKINTEGFVHFMLWTEVTNMVCIEPITFYPYAVAQQELHKGFNKLREQNNQFKVTLLPQ